MNDFPKFMKREADRIALTSQSTAGAEGYVFDGADGRQMAFWTCHQAAVSGAHAHEFDEYMVVVAGCGREYLIPRGVRHGGEVQAGTRTIHAFGGRRATRSRRSPGFS